MSSLPDPVKAFNDELAEMLTQKPPVSSSKMKDITRSAIRAQKYYKHVVMSVEKLIQKCKPEFKLSGIYVIDAIVRQSRHQNKDKDVYAGRFEINLHITAANLFKCSPSDQVKVCRTFKLWELNSVFSYHCIQKCINCAEAEARKEGVKLAEKSISKMAVKPVTSNNIVKQQKELDDQRRRIEQQQEELKRRQDALLNPSAIPPILGNLLHFGSSENAPVEKNKASETANKVKSLLDDFDYSDEDEIKQPGKKGTPKGRTSSISTPKKQEDLSTPSPVTKTHDTSIYEPDPPPPKALPSAMPDKYDTRSLEKLYTPSPIDKNNRKSSKHRASPDRGGRRVHKSERRNSERSQERARDKSRERSRDKTSRRRSSPESKRKSGRSGKRSRSTSPDHYSRKRSSDRGPSKMDCVTVFSTTIWIGNLRKTVTKEDITTLMKKYTDSCSIDMVPPRGCSYINLSSRENAETVLKELKDLKLHGAPCKVAWAPGKGCKEFKEHWNIEKGVTFIPFRTFEKQKISSVEEGGVISESTLPQGFSLQETEGAGTILEKLLVSMKGTSNDEPDFLSNGKEPSFITKQEERVSAKLDKLNDIAFPKTVSEDSKPQSHDADSIVHLLNSKDYALPVPEVGEGEGYYYPNHPGLSPPVSLDIPKDPLTEEPTSPVVEEPLPFSRPVEEPPTKPELPLESPSRLEKKTINLQTYLKRHKDDEPVVPGSTPTPASSEPVPNEDQPEPEPTTPSYSQETPSETPTPVKTPKDSEVDDDLMEWASQDTDVGKSPDKSSTKGDCPSPKLTDSTVELDLTQESTEQSEDIETKLASIRSPSGSPKEETIKEEQPEIKMEEGELESDEEKTLNGKHESKSRSRSHSQNPKPKKDKKKKKKNKKKKDKSHDSDLEEDIRKLELLKAELEREERREKKEKEKKKLRKRSPSPRSSKDKKKKEKRVKR